ncbi:helix-turn-helix domain-containing protein [Mangrovimonas sp. CR14]|uniref:helix-turn-helix domain-containing protein n=1 Tax=Mangrovimonas sp. CR14 TaxID=2706120 RepID=UPI0014217071|nr:helix-turn-helix domain-containing protein [Mangrovimonas sp. CR14]NIK92121.1 helix-turn-helix domain-containing protein [Mangrovimonas sp. CR14]
MSTANQSGQDFLNCLEKILERHLANENFGVKILAKELRISRSQLHRKLRKLSGKSTSQFINAFRLKKALEMLQKDEATASEIAYRVGFNSPSYFNTCFKSYFGFTPGEAKNKSKEEIEIDTPKRLFPFTLSNKSKYALILSGILIVVLGIAGVKLLNNEEKKTQGFETSNVSVPDKFKKTVAVMPFKSLSDLKENDFFTEGVRQDIIYNLSSINELVVRSQQSISQLIKQEVPHKELIDKLNVDYLVDGIVQRVKDRVKITVHLTDAENDVQVWSQNFDRKYSDVFILESEISRLIVEELHLMISASNMEHFNKTPTNNLEAYRYYNKARFYLSDFNLKTNKLAESYLIKSIELDPNFALGYSGLAEIMFGKNWPTPSEDEISKGFEYAQKAIALDPNLSDPHRVLGQYFMYFDWNWERVDEEFKKSIELNPNNYLAYCIYANYTIFTLGNFKKARTLINQAKSIYPDSFEVHILSALLFMQLGDYENALKEASISELANPGYLPSYWVKFLIYSNTGKDKKAMGILEESWNIHPEQQPLVEPMKRAFEENGIIGIHRWLNEYSIKNPNSESIPFNAYWISEKYAIIGEHQKALDWLEVALENKNILMFSTKFNPHFKNLRNETRFLQILKKLQLGDYRSMEI